MLSSTPTKVIYLSKGDLFIKKAAALIPHAHNEYIEIISEICIFFGIFTLVFLFFWIGENIFKAIFSQGVEGNSAKFMSIPIVSIGIHSIFEFSLRTMAIMTFTVFVICSLNLLNKNVPIIND